MLGMMKKYVRQRIRTFVPLVCLGLSVFPVRAACADTAKTEKPFGYEQVVDIARKLSQEAYKLPTEEMAAAPKDLSYDDYRMIRFKREAALWRGTALFEAQFYHQGFLFNVPVKFFEVVDGKLNAIKYNREWFKIEPQVEPKVPPSKNYGLAGFKLMYPIHRSDIVDDIGVFLGASYWRVVGRQNNFGLSGRGLAIDTGEPSGEEFPYFSGIWLLRPQATDTSVTFYALLDSRSVTGAYRFVLQPGQNTEMDCLATLFFRDRSRKFGIAPLTSMYMQGENSSRRFTDFRPEVHDSDGLLMKTGQGDWLWRPLENPRETVRISRFVDMNPRGFGLLQRDRRYESYLDLETRYQNRASVWIEPLGDWGAGSVELVEIPSDRESNDNIVTYWVPKTVPEHELTLHYRVSVGRNVPRTETARVIRTLSQPVRLAADDAEKVETRRFIVDFAGEELKALNGNQPVHPELFISGGKFMELVALKDDETGQWRATFLVTKNLNEAVDLRMHLTLHGRRLSESWMYLWDRQS